MQHTLLDMDATTIEDISRPDTYKGIYSFHKYWGKKPTESIAYFIQNYTNKTDIVLDPFLGSGLISYECLSRNRRFIGIDLNPFSIEHTNFILDPPSPSSYLKAFREIEKSIKDKINSSYMLESGKIASHYLWYNDELKQVWMKPETGRCRIELAPTQFDLNQINKYSDYAVKNIRQATFFTNSRINSKPTMSFSDIFAKRALYNIDIIINEINNYPQIIQRALLLTLTSSSGQMSSMVFAITGRGKTKNKISKKIEVGSWIIGFWRPELHFEINVWNCYENKVKKLYKALNEINNKKYTIFNTIEPLLNAEAGASIINSNCLETMRSLPSKTIKLICTDPPHCDRIPYLELSEVWNAILNKDVNFENEIIISNAKERGKNKNYYIDSMKAIIEESSRILRDDGLFLLYYNARDKHSWKFMENFKDNTDLQFVGAFPMEYSASSVVQDNRKGAMKTDYVLIMKHRNSHILKDHEFDKIPGWITTIPKMETVA